MSARDATVAATRGIPTAVCSWERSAGDRFQKSLDRQTVERSCSIDDYRVVAVAVDDDLTVVANRTARRVLVAGSGRPAIESALETELPRIAGDFIAEDANVV